MIVMIAIRIHVPKENHQLVTTRPKKFYGIGPYWIKTRSVPWWQTGGYIDMHLKKDGSTAFCLLKQNVVGLSSQNTAVLCLIGSSILSSAQYQLGHGHPTSTLHPSSGLAICLRSRSGS